MVSHVSHVTVPLLQCRLKRTFQAGLVVVATDLTKGPRFQRTLQGQLGVLDAKHAFRKRHRPDMRLRRYFRITCLFIGRFDKGTVSDS